VLLLASSLSFTVLILPTANFRFDDWRHFRSKQFNRPHDIFMRHGTDRDVKHESFHSNIFTKKDDLFGDSCRVSYIHGPFQAASSLEGAACVRPPPALFP